MPAYPRISVCIPCYNCAKHVAQTLESILCQTWKNFEVIVCDDGSKDDSMEILRTFESRGVTLIEQVNGGASSARNRAYNASTGQYVIFIDADDLISSGHLESLHNSLSTSTSNETIAMGQWDRFSTDPQEAKFPNRPTYHCRTGRDFLKAGGWGMMQCAMFLLPRSLLERYGAWNTDRSPIDDFEFFTRMFSKDVQLTFAPGAKVYYRSGLTGSLSSQLSDTYLEGKCKSLILGSKWLIEGENSQESRRLCADLLMTFEYDHYPSRPDLRRLIRQRVRELGGSTSLPGGPPGFVRLRKFIGWKAARRVQRLVERFRLSRRDY